MENETVFAKMFARRGAVCFLLMICLFATCVLRIAVIINGGYKAVQTNQSSYKISVARIRSSIYDCNMIPLTNNKTKTMAVVSPTPQGVTDIYSILSGKELERALETLREGKGAVCEVRKTVESDAISYTTVYTTENSGAEHLVGYTDDTGHGVCGIESAYDELLFSEKYVNAIFSVDGGGDILNGVKPYFDNDLSVVNDGVVTTIDINIQNIVKAAAVNLKKGAVIVSDAKTNKIRAMLSKPSFDADNLAESLTDENSPFLNRCLTSFNVGSVFKPCVAAAAMESGENSFAYNCTGLTHIIDRDFKCHNLEGHGFVTIRSALAFSCNTYFYNFGINLGSEKIYKMASSLSFGSRLKIGENLYSSAGNLTNLKNLSNDAMVANFSIGQGDLLLSPVSMLTLYSAIANGGCYFVPSVIEGVIKDGKSVPYDIGAKTRVMSKENADILKDHLSYVLSEGTGVSAAPKTVKATGKTATAQTGRYDSSGAEITNGWFCGAFPLEDPKYVVIVMSEGQNNVSCNTVFAEIADKITEIDTD